jgi:dipeptidyl aminopeptidase/acylaminoacyl peptidase
VVPFQQALMLHQALDQAGAPNQLLSMPSKEHGYFSEDQLLHIYSTIYSFLEQHGVLGKEHLTESK